MKLKINFLENLSQKKMRISKITMKVKRKYN
jgi:hypothetical protein